MNIYLISYTGKCKNKYINYLPPFFPSSFASSPTGWTLSLLVLHPIFTYLFLYFYPPITNAVTLNTYRIMRDYDRLSALLVNIESTSNKGFRL